MSKTKIFFLAIFIVILNALPTIGIVVTNYLNEGLMPHVIGLIMFAWIIATFVMAEYLRNQDTLNTIDIASSILSFGAGCTLVFHFYDMDILALGTIGSVIDYNRDLTIYTQLFGSFIDSILIGIFINFYKNIRKKQEYSIKNEAVENKQIIALENTITDLEDDNTDLRAELEKSNRKMNKESAIAA
ncbi:hypothetical protein A9Q91_03435 [Candidatus Gracilibacteria bacterium 28_42_T64]|nr:hypothetical protein A9Q91_03435 [Candidatus Gracilibacteria bacterium 28_42_T64]